MVGTSSKHHRLTWQTHQHLNLGLRLKIILCKNLYHILIQEAQKTSLGKICSMWTLYLSKSKYLAWSGTDNHQSTKTRLWMITGNQSKRQSMRMIWQTLIFGKMQLMRRTKAISLCLTGHSYQENNLSFCKSPFRDLSRCRNHQDKMRMKLLSLNMSMSLKLLLMGQSLYNSTYW